mgnify:CR=1 FL=1
MKRFIILLFYFSLAYQILSQDTLNHTINVTGVYSGDSRILLRWVPSSPSAWEMGNYYGYRIERAELSASGDTLQWRLIAPSLKPITLAEWRNLVQENQSDIYLQAAGQTIHGERQKFELTSIDDVFSAADQFNNTYSACVLSCEFSFLAAKASALGYEDMVEIGKVYVYRVSSLYTDTRTAIREGIVVINTEKAIEWPPVIFEKTYEGERNIQLYWNRQLFQPYYSAYNVYRSTDGKSYQKINEVPFAHRAFKDDNLMMFRDSVEVNYVPYHYKIEGLTSYGKTGPMSEPIVLQGRDRTPPNPPYNVSTNYLGNNMMQINWEVDPADNDIAGFRISKTNEEEKEFIEITITPLPPDQRSFIDSTCNELINNYYFIGIFDHEGNVNVSMPQYGNIIDSIPPDAPTGLTGRIDTNGVVTVQWNLGKEPDLKGYFVHYSNNLNHTFINRTDHPLIDTVWTDTIPLNVLTEDIYYKVVAVDHRFNYSTYSEMLHLRKPDLVPPTAPIFTSVFSDERGIRLHWNNSQSHDVVKNVLYRRSESETEFKPVFEISSASESAVFTDSDLEPGKKYSYILKAIDDANLVSESVGMVTQRAFESKFLPPVAEFFANLDTKKNKVNLSWRYPNFEKFRYIIYRSINDNPYLSYVSIDGKNEFSDTRIKKGDTLKYRVIAVNAKSWQSDFSNEVTVRFE